MALTKKERTELGTRLARVIVDIGGELNVFRNSNALIVLKMEKWRNALIRIRRDFHLEFKDTEKKKVKK